MIAAAWLYIHQRAVPTKLDWWGVKLVDRLGGRDRRGAGAASDLRSLGAPVNVLVGLAVLMVVAALRRLLAPALALGVAGGLAAVATDHFLQGRATRVGGWPFVWTGVDQFPSGHAVGASAVVLVALALCRLSGLRGRRFALVAACGLVVIGLTAWANVATYAHMPTSAMAGPVLSLAFVGAAYDLAGRRLLAG